MNYFPTEGEKKKKKKNSHIHVLTSKGTQWTHFPMGPCRHLKIHMHKTLSEPQYTHREHKSNLDLFLKKSSESKRQTHSWGSWFLYILPSCLARYWSISSSWTCDAECERDMEDEAEEDREEWGCAVSMFSLEEPADDGKRKSMSPCLDRKSV